MAPRQEGLGHRPVATVGASGECGKLVWVSVPGKGEIEEEDVVHTQRPGCTRLLSQQGQGSRR